MRLRIGLAVLALAAVMSVGTVIVFAQSSGGGASSPIPAAPRPYIPTTPPRPTMPT